MAKTTYQSEKKELKSQIKKRKKYSFWKILGFCVLLIIFAGFSLFIYYAKDLPRPEKFTERELTESTKIFDRTGETLLYEIYGEERREWISLEKIPEYLKKAIIATEDGNFYQHWGVDPKGIIRAVFADLKLMEPVYGGSTITQQLIRSTYLSTEKTAARKTKEIILAIELDRRYSKDQILEWYLNQIPFGRNAYGVQAACRVYFGKTVSEISLSEAATLAALIKSPGYYPNHLDELLVRRDYVLSRMVDEEFLPPEEAKEAKSQEINFIEASHPIVAPHFTLWVKQQLEEKYGREFLEQKGLKIITSIDIELQQKAEEIVKEGVKKNKIYNAYNAALVTIDPKTGEILAMVGSADYFATSSFPEGCSPGLNCKFEPQFNAALTLRQPGSSFKPFVYAAAFQKGYNDKTVVIDEPTNFGVWGGKEYVPQNFDGLFRGPVTLRQSLAQSLNIPSVKVLLYLAGLEDSVQTAENLGITTLKPPFGPSIVLGGWEVKLLEMTSAYGVFANDGLRLLPSPILKIEDSNGNLIFENKKNPMRVLETRTARLINDILSDNEARAPMFGWESNLYFENYQVAAKTGTSQDSRDGWIIGYTPSIVTGVWVGNNDNTPMAKKAAELLAGPTFHRFMEEVLVKYPKENFLKPTF